MQKGLEPTWGAPEEDPHGPRAPPRNSERLRRPNAKARLGKNYLVEYALTEAVRTALAQQSEDPVRFVGRLLLGLDGSEPKDAPAASAAKGRASAGPGAEITEEWTVASWVRSLDLHTPVASALEPKGFAELTRLSLGNLGDALRAHDLAGLTPQVWEGVRALQAQGAATGAALNSKFLGDGGTYEIPTRWSCERITVRTPGNAVRKTSSGVIRT